MASREDGVRTVALGEDFPAAGAATAVVLEGDVAPRGRNGGVETEKFAGVGVG